MLLSASRLVFDYYPVKMVSCEQTKVNCDVMKFYDFFFILFIQIVQHAMDIILDGGPPSRLCQCLCTVFVEL